MTFEQANKQYLADDLPFADDRLKQADTQQDELLNRIASVKPRKLHDDFGEE